MAQPLVLLQILHLQVLGVPFPLVDDAQVGVLFLETLQVLLVDELGYLKAVAFFLEVVPQEVYPGGVVELVAQFEDDLVEVVVLLLHLLVVAATLLGLPGGDEGGHAFEYLVRPPQVLLDEVAAVQFQEPVVELVFLRGPVPLLQVLRFLLGRLHLAVAVAEAVFVSLLLFLVFSHPRSALLPEQRLQVVLGRDLGPTVEGLEIEGGRIVEEVAGGLDLDGDDGERDFMVVLEDVAEVAPLRQVQRPVLLLMHWVYYYMIRDYFVSNL